MDTFQAERDQEREGWWRVARYVTDGDGPPERVLLPQRFTKRATAERHAYKMLTAQEQHFRRPPYLGD